MSRISSAFQGQKALIPFITAGDPSLEVTRSLLLALAQEGASLIEIGVPFSDPLAEGHVIQEADERALKAGFRTEALFDMVAGVSSDISVPLVLMTYFNPVFVYGVDRFLGQCQEAGISGIIVPDLPFEEKREILEPCHKHNVELISMIAPTSHERILRIAKEAEGFLYCVSSLGVTGVRQTINENVAEMIQMAKTATDIPCAIGFGISTPEQARAMSKIADGVIVGSAIVRIIAQYGVNCEQPVRKYLRELLGGINV
jgi:tryptophan synthase alpha chain